MSNHEFKGRGQIMSISKRETERERGEEKRGIKETERERERERDASVARGSNLFKKQQFDNLQIFYRKLRQVQDMVALVVCVTQSIMKNEINLLNLKLLAVIGEAIRPLQQCRV